MPDHIRDAIERFDGQLPIDAAKPPPAAWYVDPAFLELERETTFFRHWQFVGRLDQVPTPGDFFTGSILRRPFVVTRDADGQLRAFYNVCAHHGTRVADGCGSAEHFTCPYHGWQYHLSGELERAPGAGAVGEFRQGKVGLVPIPVSTWGPFVLLRFATDGHDLSDRFANLAQEMDSLAMNTPRFVARRVFEMQCNWKVFVDNYLDGGYHVPHMHPDLSTSLQCDRYESRLGDVYSVQSCPATNEADRLGEGATYLWVHPNFMINRYGAWMDTNLVLPIDARRCEVVFDYYHEGEITPDAVSSALEQSEQVQREDMEVAVRVQEGLESGAYSGLYAPRFEAPMYQFHRLLHADFAAVGHDES